MLTPESHNPSAIVPDKLRYRDYSTKHFDLLCSHRSQNANLTN